MCSSVSPVPAVQLEERQISGEEKGEGLLLTSRTTVQDVEGRARPHLTPETSNEKKQNSDQTSVGSHCLPSLAWPGLEASVT